jgi:hypothetical protein
MVPADPAFSRVEFGIVGRARGEGRAGSAVAAAAYNLCGRLFAENGHAYDYSRKRQEHAGHALLLPEGAPPELRSPGILWRAAEAAERRSDAQIARQVLLSIPREVPPEHRLMWVQAIAQPWVEDGAAVQIDLHAPRAAGGGEQPHAHLLLTLRRVSDAGFALVKTREWNQQWREEGGRAERRRIQERANAWLAARGIDARIDLRSLAEQGEDRPPEPTAPRRDWQRWLREGGVADQAPPTVAAALRHRDRRAALAHADTEAARAAAKVAELVDGLARAPQEPRRYRQKVFEEGQGRQRAPMPPPGGTEGASQPTPPTTQAPAPAERAVGTGAASWGGVRKVLSAGGTGGTEAPDSDTISPLDPSRPGDVARFLADFARLLARRAARAAAAEEEARRRGQLPSGQYGVDWIQWWLADLRRATIRAQREGRHLGARDAIAEVRAERSARAPAATYPVSPMVTGRPAPETPAAAPSARAAAMGRLLAAEEAAPNPAALDAARRVTAAAARGDEATLAAAAAGDLDGAREAAEDWHRKQAQAGQPTARRRIVEGPKGPRR